MKKIIIIVILLITIFLTNKRVTDKKKKKSIITASCIIAAVALFVTSSYVRFHNPYKAIEKEMESLTGEELTVVDKGSQGGTFQAFSSRGIFWCDLVPEDNSYITYKCYATLNSKENGYDFNSNYYDIKYKKQMKREMEQIGKECFGEDVETWFYL